MLLSGLAVPAAADFMAGADISSLTVHEDGGAIYSSGGVPGDAVEILSDHGTNWFRFRLFVDPKFENNYDGGYDPYVAQDLTYTLALAQRIKQAGGKILLDFHYSDTWADPGHQWKPEAWRSIATGAQLQQQVYNYTKDSIEAFKTAGVMPDMVQIGNEISQGMLWNGEYVQNVNNSTVGGENTGYPWTGGSNNTGLNRLAGLISAGINGARDGADPGDEPLIMIQYSTPNDQYSSYYFDQIIPRLQANGTDVDVIGFSYYPLYSSIGIAGIQQILNDTAAAYDKSVVIAETGFPSRVSTSHTERNQEAGFEFDVSPQGQQEFLQSLVDVVQNVPDGLGGGVFWWYAEARPTGALPVWKAGRYGLFDEDGELLPAVDVFAGLNPGVPGDYNGDGLVDAADYTVWRDGLGTTYTQADYDVWKTNFGSAAGAGAINSALVPEPATLNLWLAAVCMLLGWRRRAVCPVSVRAGRKRHALDLHQ